MVRTVLFSFKRNLNKLKVRFFLQLAACSRTLQHTCKFCSRLPSPRFTEKVDFLLACFELLKQILETFSLTYLIGKTRKSLCDDQRDVKGRNHLSESTNILVAHWEGVAISPWNAVLHGPGEYRSLNVFYLALEKCDYIIRAYCLRQWQENWNGWTSQVSGSRTLQRHCCLLAMCSNFYSQTSVRFFSPGRKWREFFIKRGRLVRNRWINIKCWMHLDILQSFV